MSQPTPRERAYLYMRYVASLLRQAGSVLAEDARDLVDLLDEELPDSAAGYLDYHKVGPDGRIVYLPDPDGLRSSSAQAPERDPAA